MTGLVEGEHLGLGEKEHLALAFNGDWPELRKEHTDE